MEADSIIRGLFLAFGALLVFALWKSSVGRPLFRIDVINGEPSSVNGAVTAAFLDIVRVVATEHNVARGSVRGFASGPFVRLRFSSTFPASAQQRVRNWWSISGWSAPRTARQRSCR